MNFRSISNIPVYGLLGVTGFICGIIYLALISRKTDIKFEDAIYVYVWSAIGAMIGAKLLYIFIELPGIVYTVRRIITNNHGAGLRVYAVTMISGGFVFFGGVFGGLIAAVMACRYFRYDCDRMISVIVPALPLVHAFGRVGCTLTGCCYGIESTLPTAIIYKKSRYAPNGVALFPVQPVEAICDILIFAVLVYLVLKRKRSGHKILDTYLLMYSIIRFILEFFRGDDIRGHWLFLSTSQWICVFIVLYYYVRVKRSKKGRV